MNKATKKNLVLMVATDMCSKVNKLSTKELKIELRNRFPEESWKKYDYGMGVSDLFHELVGEGKFISIADNGTYQTYASPTYPIKDRKGSPYIANVEKGISNSVKATSNSVKSLGKALSTASKGKTTKVAASSANIATTTSKGKLPTLGRTKALNLMQNNKGRFFTATFVKQDGTERVMNCRYLKDQSLSQLGYVKVIDEAKRKLNPNDCTRNINLQTLKKIAIGGVEYNVR